MRYSGKALTGAMLLLFLGGCGSAPPLTQPYSGQGGMTEWRIKPDIYLYHYDSGFNGEDALGYPPQLQRVWSRLGAAETCGIGYDKTLMISLLQARFGESRITHELNGIGFHAVQSRKVPGFCSDNRAAQIRSAVNRYREGLFNN